MQAISSALMIFGNQWIRILLFTALACESKAQTNPVAQQIPYVQDFGNNWFQLSNLPAGFAIWTATGAPLTTNVTAASSLPNGNDNTFDSATVVKSPGRVYGYSAVNLSGVQVSNGQLYIQ